MTYNINTIPKSYQRLFDPPPKEIETLKSSNEIFIRPIFPETIQQRRRQYEQWASDIWNTWILNVSEEDKIKYRLQDMQENLD